MPSRREAEHVQRTLKSLWPTLMLRISSERQVYRSQQIGYNSQQAESTLHRLDVQVGMDKLMWKNATTEDWGRLLLRISIGGLMLFHGMDKVLNGLEGISGLLQSKGLPGFFSWGVYVGEIVAPILILLGIYARPAGGVLAFNMLVAILLAHTQDVFRIGEHGEWAIELHMLYLLGGLSIMLLGAGRIAVFPTQREEQV